MLSAKWRQFCLGLNVLKPTLFNWENYVQNDIYKIPTISSMGQWVNCGLISPGAQRVGNKQRNNGITPASIPEAYGCSSQTS